MDWLAWLGLASWFGVKAKPTTNPNLKPLLADDIRTRLNETYAMTKAMRYKKAMEHAKDLWKALPKEETLFRCLCALLIALNLYNLEKWSEALRWANEAFELRPSDLHGNWMDYLITLHLLRANLFTRAKQYAEAKSALKDWSHLHEKWQRHFPFKHPTHYEALCLMDVYYEVDGSPRDVPNPVVWTKLPAQGRA